MTVRVGILNVTGYAGIELARLLARHPDACISGATGRSEAGKPLASVFPHLAPLDVPITESIEGEVDVVISALPHKASAEGLLPFINAGIPVVDVAADFRLHDADEYSDWYAVDHPRPDLLDRSVYGLTEIRRGEIARTTIVANPGCFPTAALLAVLPAIRHGLARPDVVVDAKTGISGGGRGLALSNHYSEVNENVAAYGLKGHRHLPEMTQEIAALGVEPRVTFVPHLTPMTRGILATCYLPFANPDSDPADLARRLREAYHDSYAGEPFVSVTDAPPATKMTYGSNNALVYVTVDARARRVIAIGAIDNLVKGAAGQAIQNMNVMLGLPETAGIDLVPVYP